MNAARKPSTFPRGIHPAESKEPASSLAIQRVPFAERLVLPLGQHIGAPSVAVVRKGERVVRGQLLARPGGFVSTSLHSPVTGTVADIAPRRHASGGMVPAIELETDAYATQKMVTSEVPDWSDLERSAFVDLVQEGGLVGLGGAAFPSHVKYALKPEQRCHTLVINGCECEPFLCCDQRVMEEQPQDVLRGCEILGAVLEVERVVIGVEANKPDAIAVLRQALTRREPVGFEISVRALETKYPQGAEKVLIRALFGDEVPSGALPIDVGMMVNNVGTMAALTRWVEAGEPLVERVVTVAGSGIPRPANLLVPIGTPLREVMAHCGGPTDDTVLVINGGPMMGAPVATLEGPLLKGTSGLLAFTAEDAPVAEIAPCIKCGRCLEACAYALNPSRMGRLARVRRFEAMAELNVMDCMECGACSFSCPARIPLVQQFRAAKAWLRSQKADS